MKREIISDQVVGIILIACVFATGIYLLSRSIIRDNIRASIPLEVLMRYDGDTSLSGSRGN